MNIIKHSKILLCETLPSAETPVKGVLHSLGFTAVECKDGIEVIRKAFSENPRVIIIDVDIPALNGNQCARVLKNDPNMRHTPVLLMGSAEQQIDRYWGIASGADVFLQKPFTQAEFEDALSGLLKKKTMKGNLFAPVSMKASIDDITILNHANDILDRRLFKAEIINELNRLDTSVTSTGEIITFVMSIIGSLYSFSLGTALIFNGNKGDFFFYRFENYSERRLEEIKNRILAQLEENHDITVSSALTGQSFLNNEPRKDAMNPGEDLYIHPVKRKDDKCVFAFDSLGYEDLRDDEADMLSLLLDTSVAALNKKIVFDIARKNSVIPAYQDEGSRAFFISCLRREMETSRRLGSPLSVFSIKLSNFEELSREFRKPAVKKMMQLIEKLILNSINRFFVVSRVEAATYSIIAPGAGFSQAQPVMDRIKGYIARNFERYLPPSGPKMILSSGIAEYDPKVHLNPESLLENARPHEVLKEKTSKGAYRYV